MTYGGADGLALRSGLFSLAEADVSLAEADVSIQPTIFNCGQMLMLGGVVLIVSVAYVLSGDGPPSPRSLKRNLEAPLPPVRGFSHVILRYLIVLTSMPYFLFWTQCERNFCSTIRAW